MTRNMKDVLAGLMFMGLALVLGIQAHDLPLGTPARLGPGVYPLLLTGLLAVLGLIIAFNGLRAIHAPRDGEPDIFATKAFIIVLLSPILFGLLVRFVGVVPGLAIAVLTVTLAGDKFYPRGAILLTAGLVIFCWLVFIVGFGLPWSAFGPAR